MAEVAVETQEQIGKARHAEVEKNREYLVAALEAAKKHAIRIALVSLDAATVKDAMGTVTQLDQMAAAWERK